RTGRPPRSTTPSAGSASSGLGGASRRSPPTRRGRARVCRADAVTGRRVGRRVFGARPRAQPLLYLVGTPAYGAVGETDTCGKFAASLELTDASSTEPSDGRDTSDERSVGREGREVCEG